MHAVPIYRNIKLDNQEETHSGVNAAIVECDRAENTADSKYTLCGYLNKYSNKHFVRGLPGSIARRRWFVYSGQTCKLYYYKSDKDPEPLGEIDIALATFSYDLESGYNGQFTISCGSKEYLLEAASPKEKLKWLCQLQTARREFNERLSFGKYKSSDTCLRRPDSGLIKDSDPLPPLAPDPHGDLMNLVNRVVDSPLPSQNSNPDSDSKASKASLNLHLKIFRSSSNSPTKQDRLSVGSIVSNPEASTSPIASPAEPNNFDKISQKFRASFNLKRPKFTKSNSDETFEVDKEKTHCRKCSQVQEELEIALEECNRQKDSCEAFKEAVHLLQRELESLQRQKLTLEALDKSTIMDEDILAIFRDKDRRIVELEHHRHQLTNSLSALTANLRDSRIRTEHLEEKLTMLTSLIEAKDRAIMDLSHQLQLSRSAHNLALDQYAPTSTFYSTSPVDSYPHVGTISIGTQTTTSEVDGLKDMLDGYKCQNSFLNKEILELNNLQKHRAGREQKLIAESSNWEAKFYQIQSKYLLLLNDLHSPQSSQHDSSVLSQLLQDVVNSQGTTDLRVIEKHGRGYDEYGFCMTAPGETDILSKADFLQKWSQTYASQAERQKNPSTTSSWESRWEALLAGTNAKELPQHPELKYLIREGIPYQYKGKVWRLLIESHIGKYKASLPSTYYHDLLAVRSSTSTLDPSAKQIELDLLRTLPNNRHYESPFSDGIPKLRRVLLAYSRHNLAVGYCQGLNRLAAIALLFLNEDDAFWCLVYVIEYLMPSDYYTRNLLGSQIDQRVLKDLINEKLPRLYSHLEHHGLDISLFTFNWFLCIYVDVIPPSTYLYIWDSYLYEGSKVLFRFSLAIFKLCEENILSKKDYMAIFDYLRSVPEPIANIHKLKHVAFQWANPLPMRFIRNRREYHRIIVKAELDEVEEVRMNYKRNQQKDEDVGAQGERDDEEETENEEEKEDKKKVAKEDPKKSADEGEEREEEELGKKEETGEKADLTGALNERCLGVKFRLEEMTSRGKQMIKNKFDLSRESERREGGKGVVTDSVTWIKVGGGRDDDDEEITIERDANEENEK